MKNISADPSSYPLLVRYVDAPEEEVVVTRFEDLKPGVGYFIVETNFSFEKTKN